MAQSVMLSCWLLMTIACGCCHRDHDDGTDPSTSAENQQLAPLELRDDTPNLLITWIDDKGNHHVVQHPPEVPEQGREAVRVTTIQSETHNTLYVADLRTKRSDGTYEVRTMPRSAWELLAENRRKKAAEALAPRRNDPSSPGTGQAGRDPSTLLAPSAQLSAIVYGASWCGACRSAEGYLRKKGVQVVEKDIEKSPQAREEMRAKLKAAGYPQTASIPVIDLRGRIIVGYNSYSLDKAIKSVKSGHVL